MKYFYVACLSSQDADLLEEHPSELEGFEVPEDIKTKEEYRRWGIKPTTEHRFISACEPINTAKRVTTADNPAHLAHGWIADYDVAMDRDRVLDKITKTCGSNYAPTWMCETFSGGLRLIWEFEAPVRLPEDGKGFFQALCKRIAAPKIHGGFDKGSIEPERYYELGTNWEKIGDYLPTDAVQRVLIDSFIPPVRGDFKIPFDDAKEEILKRFGDRLDMEFEVGARVPLFWIDDGISRIGAEVKEEGVIAYSDRADSLWNDWASILGDQWAKQFEDKRMADATEHFFTDGKNYWIVDRDRIFDETKENFLLRLKSLGFSPRPQAGRPLSELEKVVLFINSEKRVHGAGPFIFRTEQLVDVDGQNILNTSRNHPIQPAINGKPSGFPWLYKFLNNLFDDTEVSEGCTQLDLFLAWLQRFYWATLNCKRMSGHCLILSGPAGRGKTLLSKQVVGNLVGGSEDASSYLTGRDKFNRRLIEKALWRVDDTSSASDWRENRKMTDLIKRSVANPYVESRAMYKDPVEVEWSGRLIISLNEDANSLSIVPQQDSSNRDKVIGLRVSQDASTEFPPNDELEATIREELPFFANWLLSWEPSENLPHTARYGIDAWFHPTLRDAARDNSPSQLVLEKIDLFAKLHRDSNGAIWHGTSMELVGEMGNYTQLKVGHSGFEHQRLARDLQQAAENCLDNPDMRPIACMNTGAGKVWMINLEEKYDLRHHE